MVTISSVNLLAIDSVADDIDDEQHTASYNDSNVHVGATLTKTPGGAGRTWIAVGSITTDNAGTGNVYTIEVQYDGTALVSRSVTDVTGSHTWALNGIKENPTVASHTIRVTIQRTSGSAGTQFRSQVSWREISV